MNSKTIVWHPAIPFRPTDNLLSSEMIRLKRFVPSYDRESRPNMARIIAHDYERIWKQERKKWADLCLPVTTKRTGPTILLRKVVNTNLRKKEKYCPDKYLRKKIIHNRLDKDDSKITAGKPRSGIGKPVVISSCPEGDLKQKPGAI